MSTPKAVEDAGKLADELHAKVYGNPPKEGAPSQPSNQSPPADPAAQPEPVQDAAYWKSRADVVLGKYNAEVPRFAEQARLDRERIAQLEAQVKAAPPPAPAENPAPDPAPVVPAELEEKYGKEFIEDMQRMFPKSNVVSQSAPDSKLQETVERIEKRDLARMKREFFAALDARASGWRVLNDDPKFNDWLDEPDAFSGRSRRDLFDDAYTSLDVARVSVFFNSFGGINQSGAGATQLTPPPLENQLQPTQNRTESPPAGKRYWTGAEIDQFYADARRGKYRGKDGEAEFNRIEHDIFAAKREGRLRA